MIKMCRARNRSDQTLLDMSIMAKECLPKSDLRVSQCLRKFCPHRCPVCATFFAVGSSSERPDVYPSLVSEQNFYIAWTGCHHLLICTWIHCRHDVLFINAALSILPAGWYTWLDVALAVSIAGPAYSCQMLIWNVYFLVFAVVCRHTYLALLCRVRTSTPERHALIGTCQIPHQSIIDSKEPDMSSAPSSNPTHRVHSH